MMDKIAPVPKAVISAHRNLQDCCTYFEDAVQKDCQSPADFYALVEQAVNCARALGNLRSELSKNPVRIREWEADINQEFTQKCNSLGNNYYSKVSALEQDCLRDITEIREDVQEIDRIARSKGRSMNLEFFQSVKHPDVNRLSKENQSSILEEYKGALDRTRLNPARGNMQGTSKGVYKLTLVHARENMARDLWSISKLYGLSAGSGILGLLLYALFEMPGALILLFLLWPVVSHVNREHKFSQSLANLEASAATACRSRLASLQGLVTATNAEKNKQIAAARVARDDEVRFAGTLKDAIAPMVADCTHMNGRLVQCLHRLIQKSHSASPSRKMKIIKGTDEGPMCPRLTRLGTTVAIEFPLR